MKLLILSDLHLEFAPFHIPETDADIVILAGDIHLKNNGVEWALATFPDRPVLYVLGNHEYYGKVYPKHVHELHEKTADTNVHILENNIFCTGDYCFFGCTLWTNFELYGNPKIAGFEATRMMNDYKKIRKLPGYSKLRSMDTAAIHFNSLQWLKTELAKSHELTNIVITHHAPSKNSFPPEYADHILAASYASNLDGFVEQSTIALWIHGHVHKSCRYTIGNTLIVNNPKGYPDEENPDFHSDYIIEL